MQEIVLYLIGFILFVVLQSLAINGIFESMREGMIFYNFRMWLSKYVSEYWMNPLGNCVKCMSSFYGGITFWGTVIPLFGFHLFEIWIFIFDVFILLVLNYWIYKKL